MSTSKRNRLRKSSRSINDNHNFGWQKSGFNAASLRADGYEIVEAKKGNAVVRNTKVLAKKAMSLADKILGGGSSRKKIGEPL